MSSSSVSTLTEASTGPSTFPGIVGRGTPVATTIVQPKPLATGPVHHAIEIAAAIKATGLGCDSASLDNVAGSNPPGFPSTDSVSCDIGDDSVVVTLFTNHAALASGFPLLRHGVCFVNATHPSNLTYVEGDNWIVFPQQAATAHRLWQPLHATLQTIRC